MTPTAAVPPPAGWQQNIVRLKLAASSTLAVQAASGIADQLCTGSRQTVTLLLAAHYMPVEDFSLLAVLNAVSVLIAQFSNYLFKLPLLVYISGPFAADRNAYASAVRRLDCTLTAALTTILGATVLLRRSGAVRMELIAGFIAFCVASTLLELSRRIAYSSGQSGAALKGSATALITTVLSLWLLGASANISVTSVLFGLTVAMACGVIAFGRSAKGAVRTDWRVVLERHWPYAKWELLGGMCLWFATYGLIGLWTGVLTDGEVGAFRLAHTASGLMMLPPMVAENVLTTKVASSVDEPGGLRFNKYVDLLRRQMFFLFVPYMALTVAVCWLVARFFMVQRYPAVSWMLPLMLVHVAFGLATCGGNIIIRATARTRLIFAGECARALIAAAVCGVATLRHDAALFVAALPAGSFGFWIVQQLALRNRTQG